MNVFDIGPQVKKSQQTKIPGDKKLTGSLSKEKDNADLSSCLFLKSLTFHVKCSASQGHRGAVPAIWERGSRWKKGKATRPPGSRSASANAQRLLLFGCGAKRARRAGRRGRRCLFSLFRRLDPKNDLQRPTCPSGLWQLTSLGR